MNERAAQAEIESRLDRRVVAVIGATVALLLLARAAASFSPTMFAWGLDEQRFLPGWISWPLWALGAAALIPSAARRLAIAVGRATSRLSATRGLAHLLGAVIAAGVVVLLPDRTWFAGDFILRYGTLLGRTPGEVLFPQALPLDLFVHVTLPRLIARGLAVDASMVERLMGALKAALLGALAVELARLLRQKGAPALGIAAVVGAGGCLGTFTGCGQAWSDLCVVTAAVGVFGLRASVVGAGLAPLAIAVTLGLGLHREALALLPPLVAAWWLGAPARAGWDPSRRRRALLWMALPAAMLVAVAPRILMLLAGLDRGHVLPAGPGLLAAAFAPLQLLDLLNLIVMVSPLAIGAPALAIVLAPRLAGRREATFLMALALPWIAALLFIHPHDQGMVRDWGTYAAAGVALSVVAAWLIAEGLGTAPAHAWLGVTVALATLVPTLEQLLLCRDAGGGLARVESYVAEPPRRPDAHRTLALDYLGVRYGALGRAEMAARAYQRAAAITPSARILYNWALAEADRGDYRRSKEILTRLVASWPPTPQALYTLAAVSYQLGDSDGARRAAERVLAAVPGSPEARDLLRRIENGGAGADPTGRR